MLNSPVLIFLMLPTFYRMIYKNKCTNLSSALVKMQNLFWLKQFECIKCKAIFKYFFQDFWLFMPFWWEWQLALYILSDLPGIKNLNGLNDLNSLNNLSNLNDLNSLILSKNLYFKVKMYIFDGLLNCIAWKRPLKVKILRKKKESVMFAKLNHRWCATLIQ